jgi:hypothetical protein
MRSPRRIPLALAVTALLLAGSASALPSTYFMTTGAQMSMVDQACSPCTVPLTGSVTVDDDGAGNVALTDMSLAHVPYQIALPGAISIILARSSITLGAGSVSGTGSTQSSASFGSTSIANVGTITCDSGFLTCANTLGIPGIPDHFTAPLPSPVSVALGTWQFDGLGGLTASFLYQNRSGGAETMVLVGTTTPVPEPSPALLLAVGLIGLWCHARNSATSARRLARWSASGAAPIR